MRLAIITDIHEDIISLKEALRRIDRMGCDEIVCLGDISGFSVPYYNYMNSRNAHECLSLIRSNCKIIILGNHDIHAANIIPRHCDFFDFPADWYQLSYQQRHQEANNSIWLHEENDLDPLYTNEDITYLKTLPEYVVSDFGGTNVLFTHYVFPNISGMKKEFYTYGDEYEQHFQFMQQHNCDLSFMGHAHVKGFTLATENKYKQHRYKKLQLKQGHSCIGLPPIASQNNRNGFCIFDSKEMNVQIFKL